MDVEPLVGVEGAEVMGSWQPQYVTSHELTDARVREVTFEEAQPFCNFVVLKPTESSVDVQVEDTTLRPEAPPGRSEQFLAGTRPDWHDHNRSCLRCELVTSRGRTRMKQFLYDWAPPAFDHPCLWRSRTQPFAVGKNIGWIGVDFKGAQAASVSIDRTMIEFSAMKGEISNEEFVEICRSLAPADESARSRILETSIAELCYQHRHKEQTHSLPCGLFVHRRDSATELHVALGQSMPSDLPGASLARDGRFPGCFDSVFWFTDSLGEVCEVEYVFEASEPSGAYLRLLVAASDDVIRFPPALDEHPALEQLHHIDGRTVHHACVTSEFGPHEAVWHSDGQTYMLLSKPRSDTDQEWFLDLLREIVN